jgi:hypothetical protein
MMHRLGELRVGHDVGVRILTKAITYSDLIPGLPGREVVPPPAKGLPASELCRGFANARSPLARGFERDH